MAWLASGCAGRQAGSGTSPARLLPAGPHLLLVRLRTLTACTAASCLPAAAPQAGTRALIGTCTPAADLAAGLVSWPGSREGVLVAQMSTPTALVAARSGTACKARSGTAPPSLASPSPAARTGRSSTSPAPGLCLLHRAPSLPPACRRVLRRPQAFVPHRSATSWLKRSCLQASPLRHPLLQPASERLVVFKIGGDFPHGARSPRLAAGEKEVHCCLQLESCRLQGREGSAGCEAEWCTSAVQRSAWCLGPEAGRARQGAEKWGCWVHQGGERDTRQLRAVQGMPARRAQRAARPAA